MNQQVVYQDISQIHPYENNPRNNEAAVGPVAQSIKEFGFRVPILIDGKGTIIAGHTRYEAAKRLGMDKVPCIRVDDLTDAQIKAYRIPNVAGSTAYTSNWVAELFGPSNLKKSTSGFPQRLYNSVLQGALGIDKDGIFGANTEKTVKEFQSAHGLTADGIAGAKTKAALAKQL